MFTQDDLIDAIMEALTKAEGGAPKAPPPAPVLPAPKPAAVPATPPPAPAAKKGWSGQGPSGRSFLSEHDIKRMLTADPAVLRIPRGAILSPLASDWLALKGIRIHAE